MSWCVTGFNIQKKVPRYFVWAPRGYRRSSYPHKTARSPKKDIEQDFKNHGSSKILELDALSYTR